MARALAIVLTAAFVLSSALPVMAAADDWDIPDGHFFSQTGGGGKGFAVTDSAGVNFWSEFQRLGGVQAVGYPVSDRFQWHGFTVQAFQRVVFQWRQDSKQAYFVNVFDLLSDSGKDDWLLATRQTPKPAKWAEDGLAWDQIVQRRLAVMAAYPDIAKAYHSVPGDPVTMNGLPVAEVADMGNAYVLRAQRVVIQQWKEDVPWAAKGQVTVANGGDIAKEVGLYPAAAVFAQVPSHDAAGNALAQLPPPTTTPAPLSGEGKIAFTSNRDSWDDVYIMNADGSGVRKLTSASRSYAGSISPDGATVVFDSAMSGDKKRNYQLFSVKPDGTDLTRLTNNQSEDWYPSWSPDGKKIVFYSYRDRIWDLWVMNADGTDQRKLVTDTSNPLAPAAWSSSGTIAWGKDTVKIWAANSDGNGKRPLVPSRNEPVWAAYPAWSVDGRLAYSSYDRYGGVFQIWVADGDGRNARALTSWGQNFWPTWSPDGKKIAFSSYRDGNWEVYVMNADGSNQVNITKTPGDDKAPFWSK